MLFVIAYDVTSDDRRERLARVLLGYGMRVQRSVFEVNLEPTELPRMLERLRPLLDVDRDALRCYRLCGQCAQEAEVICGAPIWRDPGFLIV